MDSDIFCSNDQQSPAAFIVSLSEFNNNKSLFYIPPNILSYKAQWLLSYMSLSSEELTKSLGCTKEDMSQWWSRVAPKLKPYSLVFGEELHLKTGSLSIYTFYE